MKREFVISRQGKDYVLYAGLLDAAHQQGLTAIKTQLIQAPLAQNGHLAICFAEVTTERGTFTGIGDAEPGNVNRAMANALIRLAETRAKARALRDAVNVSMLSIEELAESAPDSLAIEDTGPPRLVGLPGGAAAGGIPGAATAGAATVGAASAADSTISTEPATAAPASGTGGAPRTPVSIRPKAPIPIDASRGRRSSETSGTAEASPSTGSPFASPGRAKGAVSTSAGTSAGTATSADERPSPATQTQLETIAKLARSVGRTVSTQDLTRAAASELITRLSEERYGARRGPS